MPYEIIGMPYEIFRVYNMLIVVLYIHPGSYISAHVLLNLLNELGKKIRCEALPRILSVFPKEFNKFSNTGARMQDAIYHMTLKSHFMSGFRIKTSRFRL